MKNITKIISFVCLILFVSCASEIDPLDYIDGGEIRYPGKANEVLYRAGKNRLEIEFTLGPDPNISQGVIYWNSGKESISFPIDRASLEGNKVTTLIENLTEGIYNFEIRTIDVFGNQSVPVYLTGRTYGDRFATILAGRQIEEIDLADLQGNVKLDWGDSIIYSGGIYFEYKNAENEQQRVLIPNTESGRILEKGTTFPKQDFKISTFFIPEPTAIDTFFHVRTIEYDPASLPSVVQMAKPYAYINLTGDVAQDKVFEWAILFDGKAMSGKEKYGDVGWKSCYTDDPTADPQWITFDVGAAIKMQRIRMDFYYFKSGSMPTDMDVVAYAGEGVPPSLDAADPDYWKDWVVVCNFDNTLLSNDDAGFLKGMDSTFEPDDVPIARYYRMKSNGLNAWGGTRFSLSELTVWAHVGY